MKVITRYCSYCSSEEGLERPIGNYKVELRKLEDQGKTMLACQTCYINKKTELQKAYEMDSVMKQKLIDRLKNAFFS
jgi:hypothetical protein